MVYREASQHDIDDTGKLMLTTSRDGVTWTDSEAVYDPEGVDPRDPLLIIDTATDTKGIYHWQASQATGTDRTLYAYRTGDGSNWQEIKEVVFPMGGYLSMRTNVVSGWGGNKYLFTVYGRLPDDSYSQARIVLAATNDVQNKQGLDINYSRIVAQPGVFVNEATLWWDEEMNLHAMVRADGFNNLHYINRSIKDTSNIDDPNWERLTDFPWELHGPRTHAHGNILFLVGRRMLGGAMGAEGWRKRGLEVLVSEDGGYTFASLGILEAGYGDHYADIHTLDERTLMIVYPVRLAPNVSHIRARQIHLR